LRHVLSGSARSACLTSSGLPRAGAGGPTGYDAIGDYACSVSDRTLCSAPPATQAPMGDCKPLGGAGEELLGATLFGTAGRRPNRDCGPRRGPRRKLPGTTRPSHIDCGPIGTRAVSGLRERRAGACIEPEQAPQGATGRGLGRSRGPQVDRRSCTIRSYHADVRRSYRHFEYCPQVTESVIDCNRHDLISSSSFRSCRYKKGSDD